MRSLLSHLQLLSVLRLAAAVSACNWASDRIISRLYDYLNKLMIQLCIKGCSWLVVQCSGIKGGLYLSKCGAEVQYTHQFRSAWSFVPEPSCLKFPTCCDEGADILKILDHLLYRRRFFRRYQFPELPCQGLQDSEGGLRRAHHKNS
jgi:hypothetical protein